MYQAAAHPAAGDFPVQNSDRENVFWTRVITNDSEKIGPTLPILFATKRRYWALATRLSSIVDTRIVYCGDCLDRLKGFQTNVLISSNIATGTPPTAFVCKCLGDLPGESRTLSFSGPLLLRKEC